MEKVRSAHYFTPSTVLTGTKRVEHDSRLEIYLVVEMAMKGGFGVWEIRLLSRHEVGLKMCVRKIAPCVSTSLHLVSELLRLLISKSFCFRKNHYLLNKYSTGTHLINRKIWFGFSLGRIYFWKLELFDIAFETFPLFPIFLHYLLDMFVTNNNKCYGSRY